MMRISPASGSIPSPRFGAVYEFKGPEDILLRAYCTPKHQPKLYNLLSEAERKNPCPHHFSVIRPQDAIDYSPKNPTDDVAMLLLHTEDKRIFGLTQIDAFKFQTQCQAESQKIDPRTVPKLLTDYLVQWRQDMHKLGLGNGKSVEEIDPNVIEVNHWSDLLPENLKALYQEMTSPRVKASSG